jgi:hypothetical protein
LTVVVYPFANRTPVWVGNTGLIFPLVAALSLASAVTALFIRR